MSALAKMLGGIDSQKLRKGITASIDKDLAREILGVTDQNPSVFRLIGNLSVSARSQRDGVSVFVRTANA